MNFLIIDDHEVVRSGVKNVLTELYKTASIFEAADEKTAVQYLKTQPIDLAVMDVQIPETNTAGLMEFIKNTYPQTRVIIFSMSAESIYAKRFLRAGAMGFVSKNAGLNEFKRAIELVMQNRKYISENLAQQLASGIGMKEKDSPFDNLSSREFDIATLLMKGKTISEIAELLNLNISTVGTYKARLLEKLGVKNMVELIELGKVYNVG